MLSSENRPPNIRPKNNPDDSRHYLSNKSSICLTRTIWTTVIIAYILMAFTEQISSKVINVTLLGKNRKSLQISFHINCFVDIFGSHYDSLLMLYGIGLCSHSIRLWSHRSNHINLWENDYLLSLLINTHQRKLYCGEKVGYVALDIDAKLN